MDGVVEAVRWLRDAPNAQEARSRCVTLMGAVEALLERCKPADLRALGEERAAATLSEANEVMANARRVLEDAERAGRRARRDLNKAERMIAQAEAARSRARKEGD